MKAQRTDYTPRIEHAYPSQPNGWSEAREVPASARNECTGVVFLSLSVTRALTLYPALRLPATLIPGRSLLKGSFDGSAMLAPGASTTRTRLAIGSKSARK